MEPEYVAVRSAFYEFSFLLCLVLLVLGIVPGVIYILYKVITANHCIVEFYDNKYILKSGVFNTQENEVVFKGVLSVVCNRSLGGKILGYGTVKADVAGKANLILEGVKEPEELRKYLLTRRIEASELSHTIIN